MRESRHHSQKGPKDSKSFQQTMGRNQKVSFCLVVLLGCGWSFAGQTARETDAMSSVTMRSGIECILYSYRSSMNDLLNCAKFVFGLQMDLRQRGQNTHAQMQQI